MTQEQKVRFILRRELWLAIAPAVLITLVGFALAYQFVEPAPPKQVVMSSGTHDGGYHAYAERYKTILARHGVKLELRSSGGSMENTARLMDPTSDVDVGFIQGGTAFAANAPDLVSLGSVYYEPLWVFYRHRAELHDFSGLQGKRIGIGAEESGTRALALQLLAVNAVVLPPTQLLPVGGVEAADMLIAGTLDVAFFVAPPESELVQQLTGRPGIRLLSFERAEAYTRRFPYLTKLLLPKGVFNFMDNIPAQDVMLLSPTANLIARKELHPALAYLLMSAASEIHGSSGLLNRVGTFPAALDADFPFSSEAKRYYQSGPPLLQRYLPFWGASLVDRLWVMLLPILALMVPLVRLVPPLYSWRMRARIYRWYAQLKSVEVDLEHQLGRDELNELLDRLDSIDRSVSHVPTPLAYSNQLYIFREHIRLVREKVQAAQARESSR